MASDSLDSMADELYQLAQGTTGPESAAYMARYRKLIGEPEPVSLDNANPAHVAFVDWLLYPVRYNLTIPEDWTRIPCPRCGQLAELRSPAGCREAWECPACGFGFDLPADPVE